MKKILIVLIIFGVAANYGNASNKYKGNTAGQFLKINPNARAVGMGNTFTSIGESADSSYYNPALITGIDRMDYSVLYSLWFHSLHFGSLFGGFTLKKGGSIGLGVSGLFYDKINVTTDTGGGNLVSTEGTASAGDFCIYGSYGIKIGKLFAVGANIKGIIQKLENENAFSFASDLGFVLRPNDNKWGIGFSAQNLGTKSKFISGSYLLPINFRIGGHYDIIFGKKKNHILLGTDLQKPLDNLLVWNIGTEYSFKNIFALRVGYQLFGDASGIKFGAGVGYKVFYIDYGFNYFGDLGTTHLVQVNIRINRKDN